MKFKTRRPVGFALTLVLALGGAGLLLTAAAEQPTGTWASMGGVADGRSGAAAVPLADGRTLIAGGTGADGVPTDSVVVYDPLANSFIAVGQLAAARVGHTATALADGRVLIAGGVTNGSVSADLELFDPASGTSSVAAQMAQPRTAHAAARLGDETVLIVGGSTVGGVVLSSAELFDPASGSVIALSTALQQARAGASATTLIDGRVLVIGGSNGSTELATAEIFEPVSQTFAPVDTQLSVARSGHTALLLPHNAGVLVAGGTSAGAAVAAADLFLPAEFPDPFSYGIGRFAATGPLTTPRASAVGGPAGDAGYAFVAGGGADTAEAYRYATIRTDKDDYAPGERAVITGSGWQPGEEVRLLFQEDPAVHPDYVLTVTADAEGNIYWDQWAPEEHDLNVRFYLLASDSKSRAQTTFTDSNSFTVAPASQTVTAGSTNTFNWTFTATNSANVQTTTLTVPAGWTAPQTGAGPGQVTVTAGTCPASLQGVSGMVITIDQGPGNGTCANSTTFTLTYSNATAPTPASPPQTYTFINQHGQDPTVTVTAAANAAPIADAKTLSTDEDTAVAITLTGTDTGTCELTFSIVTNPANGSLGSITNNSCTSGSPNTDSATVTYTPNPNFNGSDSFTYKVNDGSLDSSPATVAITINPVNDPPVANDDAATTDEDTPYTFPASGAGGLKNNDTDVDHAAAALRITTVTDPANGTAVLNGDGSVTYTPDANFFGTDTFTYTLCDSGLDGTPANGDDACDTATVTITVNAVNDAPVANDDAATTSEDIYVDIDVVANDSDVDNTNAQLTVHSISTVHGGTAVLQADGRTVRYTPASNANDGTNPGGFSFKYRAKDPDGAPSNEATVIISVAPVNDIPSSSDDSYATSQAVTLNVPAPGVLQNDSDIENSTLEAQLVTGPGHAFSFTLNSDGSFTYTPVASYVGPDSFTYRACEVAGTGNPPASAPLLCSAPATVRITVTAGPNTSGALTTYTQGGWGASPAGNNPGTLRATHFTAVYGTAGVSVGYGSRSLRFTSSDTVQNYLPAGGKPATLTNATPLVDPTSSSAGVFAGQVLALQLSYDFSNAGKTPFGLATRCVASGPLAGKTVQYVLDLANKVLGGNVGLLAANGLSSISQLNDIVTRINENYDGGKLDKHYLTACTP